MRDIIFKNLTSLNKKRRVFASCEITDKQGIRSIVHRHSICIVKEVNKAENEESMPDIYVRKEHNADRQIENFFCKIKSAAYLLHQEKLYLVLFMQSLRINLVDLKNSLT